MKVLFVVNSDQNESGVAGFAAVRMKKLLESRGFKVKIKGIPKDESWMQRLIDAINSGKRVEGYELYKWQEETVKNLSREYADFHIFDLHTAPDDQLITSKTRPGSLKARELYFGSGELGNILFVPCFKLARMRICSKSYTILEFPAKYKPASKRMLKLSLAVPQNVFEYFVKEVDLKATKAANLICPRVLAKAVHTIDLIVKTKEGLYRIPRRPMFRKKRRPRFFPNKPK